MMLIPPGPGRDTAHFLCSKLPYRHRPLTTTTWPKGEGCTELTLLFPLQYPQSLCVVLASCFLVFHFWAQSIYVNTPTLRRVHARMWFLLIHLSVIHPLRMQPSGGGGALIEFFVIRAKLLHTYIYSKYFFISYISISLFYLYLSFKQSLSIIMNITFCNNGNVLYLYYPTQKQRATCGCEHLKYGQ